MANPSADYPTSVHTPTDVSVNASSKLGSTTPTHTQVEGKQEQEIVAIQTKLGTGASPASGGSSGESLVNDGSGGSSWGNPTPASHTHTESEITDLSHDAVSIQGVAVDATELATPTDGDILVYRSAGNDFVLETKPTSSGTPAWGDITGTLSSQTDLQTALDAKQDELAEGAFADGDKTKLDGIEASADVTDTTNVSAAGAPIISSGAGVPSSTPSKVGDIYIDTTNDNAYIATGTASSADWEISNDGAGSGGISNVVEDTTPQLGGDLDPNGHAITGYLPSIDEDTMSSNSAAHVPTQQSVKAYVDANAGGGGSYAYAPIPFNDAGRLFKNVEIKYLTKQTGFSTTYTDLYTVPAGKKVIIQYAILKNESGGTITGSAIGFYRSANTTSYPITSPGSTSSGNVQFMNPLAKPVYVEGDKIQYRTTTSITDDTARLTVCYLEFDSDSDIGCAMSTGYSTTPTTLYTVPTGKKAIILDSGLHFDFSNVSNGFLLTESVNVSTSTLRIVPSGDSTSSLQQISGNISATAPYGNVSNIYKGILDAGDSIEVVGGGTSTHPIFGIIYFEYAV